MGRRKTNNNNNNNNQIQSSSNNNNNDDMSNHHLRFQDADEVIEDAGAAESSNLDDQSMCEPESSFIDSDDKTSADYYFDSYSHFGIHEVSVLNSDASWFFKF